MTALIAIGSTLGAAVLGTALRLLVRWGRSMLLYGQLAHHELVKLRGDVARVGERAERRFGLVTDRTDSLEVRVGALERARRSS